MRQNRLNLMAASLLAMTWPGDKMPNTLARAAALVRHSSIRIRRGLYDPRDIVHAKPESFPAGSIQREIVQAAVDKRRRKALRLRAAR